VGPRARLGGCGIFHPHRNSITGQSSPQRVAIPTELYRLLIDALTVHYRKYDTLPHPRVGSIEPNVVGNDSLSKICMHATCFAHCYTAHLYVNKVLTLLS
jgi:hypothetical protein